MDAKILFLGTGSGSAGNKQLRATGGIAVLTEGYQFLLDPGPGCLVRAKQANVNLRMNTAVLVSHAHVMHCSDTNAVLAAMTHNGLDHNGVLICNETFVSGTEDIKAGLIHDSYPERVIIPKPGQKIGIENVEIHALDTHHSDPAALGFKFFTKDFVLSYTGDTGYKKELVEQYMKSDILIINMPHLDYKDEFNLNKEQVIKIIKKVQPRLALLTHFQSKLLNEDPIVVARDIQRQTDVQTLAARDGFLISPQSYAAGLKHKTLNLFTTQAESGSQIHTHL